jgi:hypothetical protein
VTNKAETPNTAITPNRRHVLGAIGAMGVIGSLGLPAAHAATAPMAKDAITDETEILAFLQASSVLTGIPLDRSYIELGQAMRKALIEEGLSNDTLTLIAKLIDAAGNGWKEALARRGFLPIAQNIALIWYTGMTQYNPDDHSHSSVITYDNALAWRACSFTKPPANCGGPFGYWYDPAPGGL